MRSSAAALRESAEIERKHEDAHGTTPTPTTKRHTDPATRPEPQHRPAVVPGTAQLQSCPGMTAIDAAVSAAGPGKPDPYR
jgi:hypothetical protein